MTPTRTKNCSKSVDEKHDFSRLIQRQIADAEGYGMLSFDEYCFFCGEVR